MFNGIIPDFVISLIIIPSSHLWGSCISTPIKYRYSIFSGYFYRGDNLPCVSISTYSLRVSNSYFPKLLSLMLHNQQRLDNEEDGSYPSPYLRQHSLGHLHHSCCLFHLCCPQIRSMRLHLSPSTKMSSPQSPTTSISLKRIPKPVAPSPSSHPALVQFHVPYLPKWCKLPARLICSQSCLPQDHI